MTDPPFEMIRLNAERRAMDIHKSATKECPTRETKNGDGSATLYGKSLELLPDRRLNGTRKERKGGDVQSRSAEKV